MIGINEATPSLNISNKDSYFLIELLRKYRSAKIIQKHFRGHKTREHIKYLNSAAITIQKNWRGYVTRVKLMTYNNTRFVEVREEYYNCKAAIIQRAWKRYLEGKTQDPAGKLKFMLEAKKANEEIVNKIHEFQEKIVKENRELVIEEKKQWLNYILPKLHHLTRTKCIPGIYSLKNTTEKSAIEELLTCFNFTGFMESLKKKRALSCLPLAKTENKLTNIFEPTN